MKSSIHSLSIISLCIVKALAQQDEQNPDIVLTPSISLVPITADVSPPIASAPLPHYTGPECVPGTESSIISLEAVTYPGTTITGTADNGETVYAGVAGVTYEATVLTIPPCDTGNVSIPVITTSIPVTQNTTIVIPTTPANTTTTTTPTTATTPTGISNSTIITSLIPTTATITSSIHFNSTVTSSDDHGGPITTTVTVCDEEDVCQTTVITHTPEPTDDGGPITTTVTVCDEEDVCQTTVITHTPEPTDTATVTTTQPTSEPTETETSIQQGGAAQLVQVSSAMNFALLICAFFF